jgi:hypothetical protein
VGKYEQTDIPGKAKSDRKSSTALPNKGLRGPLKVQLPFTALYFRQLFTYGFGKKGLDLKIYKTGYAKIQQT